MAVRHESVRLTLDDDGFSTQMAKDAAAVNLLERALGDLDGTNIKTSKSMPKVSREVDLFTKSTRAAGPEVDQLSGRLRLFRDALVTIGPAALPIGAAVVPALSGMAIGLGVTVAAVGTAALAFVGMGDALGALNDYQLEPTAENLEAMQLQMAKLGPEGANFVKFFDTLGPELTSLQMAAREGLLPGAEQGLTELLGLLPEVRDIVTQVATAMGQLSADAGADLAGPEWREFFEYLQTDAAPTLVSLGDSIGNFAQGIGGLLVGLAPATRDFTSGLEAMSLRFADWAASLDSNQSFQEFLSYVREAGPQVLDFVGALARAGAGIAQAMAPIGSAVLPAITALLDVIARIASTDIGSVFFAAVAGVTAYTRAASLATAASARLTGALGTTAAAGTLTAGSLGKLAAQAGIIGVIATAGLEAFGRTEDLMAGRDAADATATSYEELASALQSSNVGRHAQKLGIDVQMLAQDLIKNGESGAYASQVMKDLEGSSSGLGAMFKEQASIILPGYTAASVHAYDAAEDLNNIIGNSAGILGDAGLAGRDLGSIFQRSFTDAERAANQLQTQLSRLNDALSGRASVRDYQASLDSATASLEANGKTLDITTDKGRQNQASLDGIAASALGVAENMKAGNRVEFLKSVAPNLAAAARGFGLTKREAAALADRLLGLGSMKIQPTATLRDQQLRSALRSAGISVNELDNLRADPRADLAYGQFMSGQITVKQLMRVLNGIKANPTADLDDQVTSKARTAQAAINAIQGKTVTVTVRTVRTDSGGPGRNTGGGITQALGGFHPHGFRAFAEGGLDLPNRHQPEIARGGTWRVWAEDETGGESYIPLANDFRRPRAKSILEQTAAMFGGQVEWNAIGSTNGPAALPYAATSVVIREFNASVRGASAELYNAARAQKAEGKARLRLLEREQERDEKEMEAQRDKLDLLKQERDSLRDSIADRLKLDIYAQPNGMDVKFTRPEGAEGWTLEQEQRFAEQQYAAQQFMNPKADPLDALRQEIAGGREMKRLIDLLRARGLNGQALASLSREGDIDEIRSFATGSGARLQEFERLFNQSARTRAAAGNAAGDAVYGQAIAAQAKATQAATAVYRETTKEVREMNRRLDRIEKQNEKNPVRTGQAVGQALDKIADGARRNGRH